MAIPRRLLINEKQAGFYHCTSRCVRRSFLCGRDEYSGNDYEHRRGWIEDRLRYLANWFSIEVFAYAVMKNHLHVVLWNNPQRVKNWDDREVARRWLNIFPAQRNEKGDAVVSEAMIAGFVENRRKVTEVRKRLSSISWFMKCLNEPIAKRANKEDGCKGHFWEGRFYSQSLEDDGAIISCMAYVDLNPVRAGLGARPEKNQFTAIRQRYLGMQGRLVASRLSQNEAVLRDEERAELERAVETGKVDRWLGNAESLRQQNPDNKSNIKGIDEKTGSDWVLANLSLEQYLDLVDWTGKNILSPEKEAIPQHLESILDRMNLAVDQWVESVEEYKSLFRRAVAPLSKLEELAIERGQKWLAGRSGAKRLYKCQ